MTSLSTQLQLLSTVETTHLAADKTHESFLFGKRRGQTPALDRETVFRIGRLGLTELIDIEPSFAVFESTLFAESCINTAQRSIMSRSENDDIDREISSFLHRLMPYFLLNSAHRALEWLVYRYQVHQFNVDTLLAIALPYHDTNTFARLLAIMHIADNNRQWCWLIPFQRSETPVSRRSLLNQALSSGHILIRFVCEQIPIAIKSVGESYVVKHLQRLFTFVASLLIGCLADTKLVDEALISRIVPQLALGLRSNITPYRLSCLMVVAQLAIASTLSSNVIQSLMKLILLKMKPDSMAESMSTIVVICQRQSIDRLPQKALLKLVRKNCDLDVTRHLSQISRTIQLDKFLGPFWRSLFDLVETTNENDDDRKAVDNVLAESVSTFHLSADQSTILFRLVFENAAKPFATDFLLALRACCLRFSDAFDSVRNEWLIRDKSTVDAILKQCRLDDADVAPIVERKKRRRRNSSTRSDTAKSTADDKKPTKQKKISNVNLEENAKNPDKKTQLRQMRRAEKAIFIGDPIDEFRKSIDVDIDRCKLALENINADYFVAQKSTVQDDFVRFAIDVALRKCVDADIVVAIRNSLIDVIPISIELLSRLISIQKISDNLSPSPKKRTKTTTIVEEISNDDREMDDKRMKQLRFLLEVMHANASIHASTSITLLVAPLFAIIDRGLLRIDDDGNLNESSEMNIDHDYVIQLALSLLVKLLGNVHESNYHSLKKVFKFDLIIKCIRSARDHRSIREGLKLLAIATRIRPESVLSHIMSVFTFMGSGLFRKDDAFTFGVVHETLDAILSVIATTSSNDQQQRQLIDVYRTFASTLADIPVHRRSSIITHLIRQAAMVERAPTAGHHLWLMIGVLLEHFCVSWQRPDVDDTTSSSIGKSMAMDEFALTICGEFSACDQLECAASLLDFVVRLGVDNVNDDELIEIGVRPFDRQKHSLKKLRHFRFVVFGWVSQLLAQTNLIAKLSTLSSTEIDTDLSPSARRLFSIAMIAEQFVVDATSNAARAPTDDTTAVNNNKYWRTMSVRANTVLQKLRTLLPAGISLTLIGDLLRDDTNNVRVRVGALQLLNSKLLQQPTPFTRTNVPNLVDIANILNEWIDKESTASIELRQCATYSLKLIARVIGIYDRSPLIVALDQCARTILDWKRINDVYLGSVLLCAAEMVACVDIEAVVQVAPDTKGSSMLAAILDIIASDTVASNNLLLTCALTCLQRVIEKLAQFISPYLSRIIIVICRLQLQSTTVPPIQLPSTTTVVDSRQSNVSHRLSQIRKRICALDNRLLMLPFRRVYEQFLDDASMLSAIFSLVRDHFETIGGDNSRTIDSLSVCLELMFDAFTMRSRFDQIPAAQFDCLEEPIIDAFVALVVRLSENVTRPIMNRLADWAETALDDEDESKAVTNAYRLLVTYRICNRLADRIGPLFTLFADQLFGMTADILNRCNLSVTDVTYHLYASKSDAPIRDRLIRLVLDVIGKCSIAQSKFLNSERVTNVIKPMINQLDNTKTIDYIDRIVLHLAPCIARLASAINDDIIWKLINSEILFKTRSTKWRVRRCALTVLTAFYTAIGENVAPLLPDIVPFLSELFEDENETVESECQTVLKTLERVIGDGGIQQYM